MKHEDDISDNTKESFLDAQEKAHGWLGNEKTDKKFPARNYTRNPSLDHAAGDYEPIQENSRFHLSEDQERTAGKSSKESRFTQNKFNDNQRALPDEQHPADKTDENQSISSVSDQNQH
ncbi:hypothetical protein [Sporosarcina sp. E16_8]|uniref:hypothetical protein n=1 Tax=Sporosarcina sp. E16_8 TaxID=2789295 RepID=UPI001A925F94|nr:hypothetical protein [Sporosarcina sp. E16_8]MBO0588869.1 hypothetical protein [Sporosarcina sp. E16_8]